MIVRLKTWTAMLAVWASLTLVASAAITNVVETGGDNEATDTITAKWSGQTWPISVANEPVPGAVIGANYTTGVFGNEAPSYVDRNHRYLNDATNNLPVPAYLTGRQYIMSGNDNRDNATYKLDVTVNTPSTAYLLIDTRQGDATNTNPPTFGPTSMQWVLDQGWIANSTGRNRTSNLAIPDEVGFDEGADGTINQWMSVYRKNFQPGTFSLFQADNAGQNMYGVVVGPLIPEPATALMVLGAAVVCITSGQRRSKRER